MPLKAVGLDQDSAGGFVSASEADHEPSPRLTGGGKALLLKGDSVESHGDHSGATMNGGTPKLTIGGKQVCLDEDSATCGHALQATGNKLMVGSG
jgi:uncharacterized Zn-binding protein involved in type VI secretion